MLLGRRINAAGYIEVLEAFIKALIYEVPKGSTYVFQQDSTPSHKAKITQEWLSDSFCDHLASELARFEILPVKLR